MQSSIYQHRFVNGRHLRAARTLAGPTQARLAALAGLHPNSIKRLESETSAVAGHAANLVQGALCKKGIIAETWPVVSVRLADKR